MLPLILLGFVMLTLGFALLCFGEVPFVGGTRIPALRSRIIGGILVSFLPMLWLAHFVLAMIVRVSTTVGVIMSLAMVLLYVLLLVTLVFRILVPKQEPRENVEAMEEPIPFAIMEEDAIETIDDEREPFHFS
jgi:hypothetical protein